MKINITKMMTSLLSMAMLLLFQSCDAQSLSKLAMLDCSVDITLSTAEKNACKIGTQLAAKVVIEAELSMWSSDAQFVSATRRAEKLCDKQFKGNSKDQNACYVGLQYYRDAAVSNSND